MAASWISSAATRKYHMKKSERAVALVDSKFVTSVDINQIITSFGEWVAGYMRSPHCFEPYMISFMFKATYLENGIKDQQMRDEIFRVYGRFLTECVRYPWSERNRGNRPILLACPDWPVWKKDSNHQKQVLPSEGVHWAGILLVPPRNKLDGDVKTHFEVTICVEGIGGASD